MHLYEHQIATNASQQMTKVTEMVREDIERSGVREGIAVIFSPHTTAGFTINENADPDVRTDLEAIFNHLVKEREAYYEHTLEGPDDMPAPAKAVMTGVSLTIPITNGRLNLGTWQGIYLCEFRYSGGVRKVVATVVG